MNEIIDFLNTKEMLALSGASSIFSLALTCYVFIGIRKIRKQFMFNARVPNLLQRLTEASSRISSSLDSDSINSTHLNEALADTEILLKSLRPKIGRPTKNQATKIISLIRKIDGRRGLFGRFSNQSNHEPRDKAIRTVHIEIYKIIQEISELYEDSRWESNT